jgi:hypothetical protein
MTKDVKKTPVPTAEQQLAAIALVRGYRRELKWTLERANAANEIAKQMAERGKKCTSI